MLPPTEGSRLYWAVAPRPADNCPSKPHLAIEVITYITYHEQSNFKISYAILKTGDALASPVF
jgi:hypothetical protein